MEPIPVPSFLPEALEPKPEAGRWWQRLGDTVAPARLSYAIAALFLIITVGLAFWVTSLHRENAVATVRLEEERARLEQATAAADDLEAKKSELEERIRRYERQTAPDQKEKQIAELQRTVDELARSHANVPIVNLEPQGSMRGQTQTTASTIDLPTGVNAYLVVLNVNGEQKHVRYTLEIEDQKGAVVRREPGLRKTPNDTFTLVLTRGLLPPGEYHFRLYGTNGIKQLIEDYTVVIRFR
ncbi:MAG TPA: hypothetical protein VFV34_15150 [Blastocatellia bacterium]|nr:hypothetical protein [Blastocatellia bacterium]